MGTTEISGASDPAAKAGAHLAQVLEEQEDPMAYILRRARSEVHLLLDNLSANPDTTISALTASGRPAELDEHWLEEICRITWPPETPDATPRTLADQAALLIRAKDYLNSLAKPASGASIAFTLMVTQERIAPEDETDGAPSRSSLACDAYPDLVPKARGFRRWMFIMAIALLAILAGTCLLSWYVAMGNAALADLTSTRAGIVAAESSVSDAQTAFFTRDVTLEKETADQSPQQYSSDYCESKRPNFPTVDLMKGCQALRDREGEYKTVKASLASWTPGGESAARWILNVLGGAVLPVLYGFLGAAAAIVRSLSRKIKGSQLSPRDFQLSFQQLALGAVIGACIGLFISQPGSDKPTEMALLGPVPLSSSAISFVAGFGVEAVFQALEALISRIFNIAPAASAPSVVPVIVPAGGTTHSQRLAVARREESLSTE
ncbi:MAG TPA: hypothetical protein VF548_05570 [Allosphingosinicella sp.]|jgi:hypothetical protein